MKRFVIPALFLLAALSGCQHKPPAALIGKWEHVEDMGMLGKVAVRLNLKDTGRFTVRKKATQPPIAPGGMNLPSMPSGTDGPENEDGELIEAGDWDVKDGQFKFVVDTLYIAGVNVGPTQVHTEHSKYALQGNNLTLESKALVVTAPARIPGGPPQAAPTTISFTKMP
ncbi:MAG TPA: hypothetical protein VGM37_19065 [Armatimonadota bacterium]|jgi:hypothetical protein